MRVLKTINTVGAIKKESFSIPTIGDSNTQHQRRGAMTLEKVNLAFFFCPSLFVFICFYVATIK